MKKAKRILSLVLTLLMLFSMSVVATSAYTAPDGFAVADTEGVDITDINGEVYGLIGDADLSESINVRDATLIQKHAAELVVLNELQLILSDVNFDGNVNVKDATPIQKWVADLDTLEPINKLIYAPIPETSAPAQETTAAPETTAPAEETTAAPETSAPAEETTAAPETSAPAEETTAAPETTAPAEETTAAPETSAPAEETTAAPEISDPAEETTAAPETSAPVQETTAAPETSDPVEETTAASETTVPDVDMVTIYFTNSKGWEGVYIYGFYGVEGEEATGEPLGAYPGTEMTYVDTNSMGQDIYSAEVPADIDYIKFADGTKSNNRTNNIPKDKIADNAGFYISDLISGTKWDYGTYTYEPSIPKTTAAFETSAPAQETTAAPETSAPAQETTAAPETSAPAEETTAADSNTITVYFTNNWAFLTQNAYWWGSADENPQWPGVAMTYVETNSNGQDIYSAEIPADATGLIFNGEHDQQPGVIRQTVDITEFVDGEGFYCDTEKDGKIVVGTYTFEPTPVTTAAPETSAPAEETTAAPETSAPAEETTAAPETTAPAEETTAAPETSAPAQETTAAPETSDPAEETTAAPETSDPAEETTAAPETSAPAQETTAAPETSAPDTEPETITVYAINSSKWDVVSAYYWGGVSSTWPGTAMTKTGDTVNGFDVYSITFDTAPENIIFNNNSNGSQTDDLTFRAGQYYDIKACQWYTSLDDVPEVSALSTDRYLAGSFNNWSAVANEFTITAEGDEIAYVELELAANTTYEFKIVREGKWTSCKTTLTITDSAEGLTFSSSISSNTKLVTKAAGTYVFAFGLNTSQLSVTYPE